MRSFNKGRAFTASVVGLGLALSLAACGSDDEKKTGTPGASGDCAAYEQYGDLKGKTVSVYTSIVTPEDTPHIDSYKPFEECTGAKITYEGSKEFEAQLLVKIKSGAAPDIAYIPQPGLLSTIAKDYPDALVEASAGTVANVE